MADIDFSDPAHRITNLMTLKFAKVYAKLRHHIFAGDIDEPVLAWLQGYMMEHERQMAYELDLPLTSLVGRLVDLGAELVAPTDGQDRGEVPTA